jgi:rubrerythrin
MIAHTSYNPMEINEDGTIQAVLAMLSQRHVVSIPRWDCEVCGMIHLGSAPETCESCGSTILAQHSDIHCEMNNHW